MDKIGDPQFKCTSCCNPIKYNRIHCKKCKDNDKNFRILVGASFLKYCSIQACINEKPNINHVHCKDCDHINNIKVCCCYFCNFNRLYNTKTSQAKQ